MALRRARLKLKKLNQTAVSVPSRKKAVLLEGETSDFAEGRDNLLINALLKEEIERQQNLGFEDAGSGEEDPEFEAKVDAAIAFDAKYMEQLIEQEQAEELEGTVGVD